MEDCPPQHGARGSPVDRTQCHDEVSQVRLFVASPEQTPSHLLSYGWSPGLPFPTVTLGCCGAERIWCLQQPLCQLQSGMEEHSIPQLLALSHSRCWLQDFQKRTSPENVAAWLPDTWKSLKGTPTWPVTNQVSGFGAAALGWGQSSLSTYVSLQ